VVIIISANSLYEFRTELTDNIMILSNVESQKNKSREKWDILLQCTGEQFSMVHSVQHSPRIEDKRRLLSSRELHSKESVYSA
jgi:hypothetical protein